MSTPIPFGEASVGLTRTAKWLNIAYDHFYGDVKLLARQLAMWAPDKPRPTERVHVAFKRIDLKADFDSEKSVTERARNEL